MTATREQVEKILRDEVAPALKLDPTGIDVVEIDRGVAVVRIGAVCASCPASLQAVIAGMEAELKNRLPEIDYIEASP